jgi:glycerol-3-phosphate O-acyltransferase
MLDFVRSYFDRLALRAVHRAGARVERYKLARRSYVRGQLIADPIIADAVARHAAEQGISNSVAWRIVDRYVDEIVPFFNIIAYYHLGYRTAGWLLNLFYKVSV